MSMEKNKDVKNPDELTLAELGNLSDEELLAMDWLKGFVLPELVVVIEDNPSPISPEELLKLDKYLIAEEIERSYEEQYGEK